MSENLPPDASPPKKPGSHRQGVPPAPDEGSAGGVELPMASAAPAGGKDNAAPGSARLRGVPLGIDPAGSFRLELVLRPESRTGGVYPFATLGQNGRYARVLLARVASADGVPFRYLALKVQRDRYDVETDRGNVLSNVEIAELWEEEHRNLKLLRGDPEGAAAELLGGDTPLRVLPPTTFCRKREVFFQPPCPSCGKVLRDCEDDGLLTRRGLPRYSESNIRYLHCPACLRASPDGPLYRPRIEEKERRQGVKDGRALIGDWKTLALAGRDGGQGPGTEAEFPCRGCQHAGECYGAAAPQAQAGAGALVAVDHLTALSAFDFRVIPIEVLRLRYDEFVDCLGGIGWDDFLGEHRGGREDIPERIFLADLRPRLERTDRYLFSGCGGLEALEVFRLKLALFTQLVRRVRRFHELTGKAHLDLKPENAMVDVPPVPAELPILWNFRVKLIDLCAATAFVYGEDGSRKSLPSPPVNYAEVYTSPIIRHGQFGHLRPCDLQITGTTDLGDGRRRISARLRSSDLIPEEYTDKDVFRISLSLSDAEEPFFFWASRTSGTEMPPGILEVAGEPSRIPPGVLDAIQSLGARWLRGTNFETYHAYGPPCDNYSLGVILLRTLLSGRRQNMAIVTSKLLQPVLNELQRLGDSERPPAPAELTQAVRGLLASNACARPEMVFWDGDPARPAAIPAELWSDALLLSVRLCTCIPGFSFPAGRGDWDRDAPERALEPVLRELEALGSRVHSTLFSREELNREVREAIGRLRGRLRGKGA